MPESNLPMCAPIGVVDAINLCIASAQSSANPDAQEYWTRENHVTLVSLVASMLRFSESDGSHQAA